MRKHYTATFKAQVVQELLREDKTIAQIAAEYEVHPTQLNKWKSTALQGLPSLFEEKESLAALKASHEAQLNQLYAEIGRLTTQLAWLEKKTVRAKAPTEQQRPSASQARRERSHASGESESV